MISEVRESIRDILRDPVTKLLLEHSQLTLGQLETLLADTVSIENAVAKGLRRLFRPSKGRISRGAFNRTLLQAQKNVIRSIYTLLLLGYVGMFDSVALQPFIELADAVQSYVQEARQASQGPSTISPDTLRQLKLRLSESISALGRRQSFKDRL